MTEYLIVIVLRQFALGLVLLAASIFTLPSDGDGTTPRPKWPMYTRLLLAPLALWAFWDSGFGHFKYAGVALIGNICLMSTWSLYGIMRVIDTNIASIWDKSPPLWISTEGKHLPLPTTVGGRLAYTFDLLFAVRGGSWYKGRHWDFSPPNFALHHSSRSKLGLVLQSVQVIAMIYFFIDILDAFVEMANFDTTRSDPVTSLSIPLQIFFTLLFCVWIYVTSLLYLIPINFAYVALGLTENAGAWPPIFDSPSLSSSLADFWTNRWHQTSRRSFARIVCASHHLTLLLFDYERRFKPSAETRRLARLFYTFFLSAILHMAINWCIPSDAKHPYPEFWDWSVFRVFVLQPFGILFDVYITASLGPGKRTAWVRRVYAWGWMIWTARWYCNVVVKQGLWDKETNRIPWSPFRGILFGRWMM